MALIDKLSAIGDAIRAKTGKTDKITLDEMPIEIAGIETGSGNGGDFYEGVYEVIPKIIQQTLLTKNKIMAENLTIKEIPFYEVSNAQKGKTIIIGGD